ncbi:Uncharacterised protein [Escherichia coli]|uniref:Uncharacterized protein n=1 Tax=Escherichia coli TaxID=562 RepID=A0A2X1LFS0_ECOLX|nr:Uncharacterised protein [Escherichia coli]
MFLTFYRVLNGYCVRILSTFIDKARPFLLQSPAVGLISALYKLILYSSKRAVSKRMIRLLHASGKCRRRYI